MTSRPTADVIISTYNRPDALRAVLVSLEAQSDREFLVTIADDGSGPATADVVHEFSERGVLQLRHVWQEDTGFRLAAIRNRALAAGDSDYVVFLDGDCIVARDFVENHVRLAERGFYVRGSRIDLSEAFARRVLEEGLPIHTWGFARWLPVRLKGGADRMSPLLRVPLGPLRKTGGKRATRAAGSNIAVWREEIAAVNGFDEAFEGYGYEDWELLDRLYRLGVRRKNGRYAIPYYHVWHPPRTVIPGNRDLWEQRNVTCPIRADAGLDGHGASDPGPGYGQSRT